MRRRSLRSLFRGTSSGRPWLAPVLLLSMVQGSMAGETPVRLETADQDQIATTSSSVTSSTYANCIDFAYCDYDIVLTEGGDFLSLELDINGADALEDSYCDLDESLEGAVLTHSTFGKTVVSGIPSPLAAGARLLSCSGQELYDRDYNGVSFDFTDLAVHVTAASGRDGEPVALPRVCAANVDCQDDHCGHSEYLPEPRCGDAFYNGYVNAADALVALRTSVGASTCEPFSTSCDADGSGSVTASDALAILKVAVGQPKTGLACPMPCND